MSPRPYQRKPYLAEAHPENRTSLPHELGTKRGHSLPLSRAFFDVDLYPLFWEKVEILERPKHFLCPYRYAVVREDEGYVYSTVTVGYYLILNKDAYDLGKEVACYAFHSEEDVLIGKLNELTEHGAACEMSIQREEEIKQPQILNGWHAIVRISNSYNKTKSLKYTIGFEYESGASLLFPEYTIEIKDPHSKPLDAIREEIREKLFKTKRGQIIVQIENVFVQLITALKAVTMSKYDMLRLFCMVYKIKISSTDRNIIEEAYKELDLINKIIKSYKANNFQNNAYLLLLAFGDYVYNYRSWRFGQSLGNNQLALGKWVQKFIKETEKPDFSLHDYFGRDISDFVSKYLSERGE